MCICWYVSSLCIVDSPHATETGPHCVALPGFVGAHYVDWAGLSTEIQPLVPPEC